MIYLVCYDIASPKRLYRVARQLEKWGLRVQYSFFQCDLSREKMEQLQSALLKLIKEKFDRLYVYPICESCAANPVELGTGKLLCLDSFEII